MHAPNPTAFSARFLGLPQMYTTCCYKSLVRAILAHLGTSHRVHRVARSVGLSRGEVGGVTRRAPFQLVCSTTFQKGSNLHTNGVTSRKPLPLVIG